VHDEAEVAEEAEVPDLMTALRQSVEAAHKGKPKKRARKAA
jgi:non-homologous end joining protein Ku